MIGLDLLCDLGHGAPLIGIAATQTNRKITLKDIHVLAHVLDSSLDSLVIGGKNANFNMALGSLVDIGGIL